MTKETQQEKVFADIGKRAAALLLDLLMMGFVAAVAGKLSFPYVFPLLAALYFTGMPLSPLQGTLGKWICRIKLCDRRGERLTLRASLVRAGALAAWFAIPVLLGRLSSFGDLPDPAPVTYWWLLFALPWAPAGFMPRRESAFDLLVGSLVVQYKADAQSVAAAEAARKPGILNVGGAVALCLAVGFPLHLAFVAQRDMGLRSRVAYAVSQTMPVLEKIKAFQETEQRWPTAVELNLPEWSPFPDGGGFRVQGDGTVLITFSVLPELKGRSIAFRLMRTGKEVRWQCSADAGLKPAYLPSICRPGYQNPRP